MTEEEIKKLAEALKAMNVNNSETTNAGIKELQTAMIASNKQNQETFSQLGAAIKGLIDAKDNDTSENERTDNVDLETLSNTDLVRFNQEQTAKMIRDSLKEALDPLRKDLENTRQGFRQHSSSIELENVKSKYKDFDEWHEEMRAILKKNPGLDLDSAYKLSRVNDEEKAKKLDEKFSKGDENSEDDKDEKPAVRFGGLLSSEVGEGKGSVQRMNPNDAFDAAVEKVTADFPDLERVM